MIISLFSIILGLFFLVLVIGGYYLCKIYDEKLQLDHRLSKLTLQSKKIIQPIKKQQFFQLRREDILQKRIKRYIKDNNYKHYSLKPKLYKAGITLPLYYVLPLLASSIVVIACLLHYFAYIDVDASLAMAVVMVVSVFWFYLDFKTERRKRELVQLMPQALDIIIRGLKAGFSLERTFTTVANEIPDPIGSEFKTICEQIAFGVVFEDAIRNAAERVQDSDFDFFIIAMVLQRRIGGSLAELMISIAQVLRKREELKLKIKSLSAEAKATGIIVGILPFVATFLMSLERPGYLNIFLTDPIGKKLLYSVFAMIVAAILIVKRLIKFDI